MSRETLSSLTRGIHHAAASTSVMLAQQYVQMMTQFFEETDDKKLRAKMVYVQIDANHWVPVPLIALVAPKGLALDRMRVSLSVRIDETVPRDTVIDEDQNVDSKYDRLSMKVTVSPRTRDGERRATDITDVDLEFKAGEPPEAMMRIIDSFAGLIDPKGKDERGERILPPLVTHPPTRIPGMRQVGTGEPPGASTGQGGGSPAPGSSQSRAR